MVVQKRVTGAPEVVVGINFNRIGQDYETFIDIFKNKLNLLAKSQV